MQFFNSFASLRKLNGIFIFIFFSAMIFTVVGSLPLIEEEVTHKKIELVKKALGSEGSDTSTDDNPEEDAKPELQTNHRSLLAKLSSGEHQYVHSFLFSSCLLDDKNTPPPKV